MIKKELVLTSWLRKEFRLIESINFIYSKRRGNEKSFKNKSIVFIEKIVEIYSWWNLFQFQHILTKKIFMILSKYSVYFLKTIFLCLLNVLRSFLFLFCSRKDFFHFFKLSIVCVLIASYFVSVQVFVHLPFLLNNKKKVKNFKKIR
jgi:hypothetical protein